MFLSIIVPVYNAEKTISSCINSILMQDFDDFELILVNDGSTDKSLEICKDFKNSDSRVFLIDKENGGSTSARKAAANVAKGKYVICIDSDDIIFPGYFSYIKKIVSMYEPDSICFGFREKNKNVEKDRYNNAKSGFYSKELFMEIREKYIYDKSIKDLNNFGSIFYSLWSKAIKKDIFIAAQNMIDNCVVIGEDMLCYSLCLKLSKNLYVSNEIFYRYELFENSVMHRFNTKRIYKINETVKAMKSLDSVDDYKIGVFAFNSLWGEMSKLAKYTKKYIDFSKSCKNMFDISPLFKYISIIKIKNICFKDKLKVKLILKKRIFLLYLILK